MPVAVTLDLDPVAASRIEPLWDALERDTALPTTRRLGVRPHLSLAVYEELDPAALLARLDRFAQTLEPVAVSLASIGFFVDGPRATIFLGPVPDRVLLDLHGAFHHEFADCVDRCIAHYRPLNWVPHLTLAQDVAADSLPQAVARLAAPMAAFSGTLDVLSVVRYLPVEPLARYVLGPPSEGSALEGG
jgi:2'-5' RNA ligase